MNARFSLGHKVIVLDFRGSELPRRALSGVEKGRDFPVVWVCSEEEWVAAQAENREPTGFPWPAEDVRPL